MCKSLMYVGLDGDSCSFANPCCRILIGFRRRPQPFANGWQRRQLNFADSKDWTCGPHLLSQWSPWRSSGCPRPSSTGWTAADLPSGHPAPPFLRSMTTPGPFLAAATALKHLHASCCSQVSAAQLEALSGCCCPGLAEMTLAGQELTSLLPTSLRKLNVDLRLSSINTQCIRGGRAAMATFLDSLSLLPCLQSLSLQRPRFLPGSTVLPSLGELTVETSIGPFRDNPTAFNLCWFWDQPCSTKNLTVYVDMCVHTAGGWAEIDVASVEEYHDRFLRKLPLLQLSSVVLLVKGWHPESSAGLMRRWQALSTTEVKVIPCP